ncbi:DNA repair protein RadA [Helicobacter sp. 13S00482-2]|uniref:DNA repair protein RadA n=1 Tax=Helicobacter sp. 13S00482-2 TaxID=1476200 RepID=UPI000BA67344|nr:DNA repair protein RadA [Helicobacter sp. 13S00482-2]PAF53642.1 DNA repair protein RadA [Helicobacter sp. 13S00482-2]
MAKKSLNLFECQHCGFQSTKWMGKCSNCGAWESLVELTPSQIQSIKETNTMLSNTSATSITSIEYENVVKFSSSQEELDIVLGGGIVPGGLYLVGGSPGVGKSTLLLKVAGGLAKNGKKVLYVSGEESAGQIKLRAQRLDCVEENLYLLNEIDLNSIKSNLVTKEYPVCVIDSIQTIYSPQITSAPGSISQVREITFELMRLAKQYNIAIFIIGHITKEGSIAGPRVLEHMVDTVLYFEGDPSRELRMLRGFKNRFGTTSEIGIFEMKAEGLVSAKNASKLFFSQRKASSGSAITVILEGSRAIVLEIQALVSESSFAVPKRSATGFDSNRLNMLLALLEKKLEIPLNHYDVFVNVTGGIKINETSADLALIASVISSFKNRPLNNTTVFMGEVSLTGDIREISNIDTRLKEMESYGFSKAIIPKKPSTSSKIKCYEVTEVTKLLDWM